jgi:hypothetical protein
LAGCSSLLLLLFSPFAGWLQVFLGKVVDLVKDESVLNPPTTLKLVPSKATPGRRG